jgi:hypothetical protein
MFEVLPIIVFNTITALLHGGLIVAGFAILKRITSWAVVLLLAIGMAVSSVALSFAGFLLQGWEQASRMLLPGGDMFATVGLPTVLSATLSMLIIFTAAYGLFVQPGNEKNV